MGLIDFKIRLYKTSSVLGYLTDITLSNITIIRKNSKFDTPHVVETNAKKFGYTVEIKGKFLKAGGSNSYPTITFKGEYIDIIVRNFPRYPSFYQDKYAARSSLNGYGYVNYMNRGFPTYEKFRKIEITCYTK